MITLPKKHTSLETQNPNLNGFNNYEPKPREVNYFQRRGEMERLASRLLRGAKSGISTKVFSFFLSEADNVTGVSRHSIETISRYLNYGKQWTQKGINFCVEAGLITRVRRGIKKTNIYTINYELIGEHSYKPHNRLKDTQATKQTDILTETHPCNQPSCFESAFVARQSILSFKNISNTNNRNTSFEKFELKKESQELVSLENDPVETYLPESSAVKSYKERTSCSKTYKKSIPDPTSREEECEFIRKDFYLSEKSERILRGSTPSYLVAREYEKAFKRYIENLPQPFEERGRFWTQKNTNQYFPLWLRETLRKKKGIESQGKRFFHYHDRQAYKENKKFLASESKLPYRRPQVEVEVIDTTMINTNELVISTNELAALKDSLRNEYMIEAEPDVAPKAVQLAQHEEKLWEEPKSIATSIAKVMANIQHNEGEDSMKDKSMWNAFKDFRQEYKAPAVMPNIKEVEEIIAQEPDKLGQGILKVCAKILPDAVFLKAEETLKIIRTEDEDEITFDIFMEGIYSYEHKIRAALQEALVSAKGKKVYVRLTN